MGYRTATFHPVLQQPVEQNKHAEPHKETGQRRDKTRRFMGHFKQVVRQEEINNPALKASITAVMRLLGWVNEPIQAEINNDAVARKAQPNAS